MNQHPSKASIGTHRVRIVLPCRSVRGATVEQLKERMRTASRVESQAKAIRVEAAAELQRRQGQSKAEKAVREQSGQTAYRSRKEVETAQKMKDLPRVRRAFGDGEISFGHAKIIADAAGRVAVNEQELVDLAKEQPVDVFARTARQHEQEQSGDDGVARLEQQRRDRKAGIRIDFTDGMTVLYARFDPITGARIKKRLSAKTNELWREEDRKARLTPEQRMVDALADLICQPKGHKKKKGNQTDLLLIAHYDPAGQTIRKARLADGTPIPVAAFRDQACEGRVIPAVFDTRGQPLWVGRAKRVATPAQRIALIARDRRCVGCGADSDWCQAHHVVPWQAGGPTDLDNMCLLCSRCHHRVHDEGWRIEQARFGQYVMHPPLPNRKTITSTRTPRSGRRRPVTKLLL